MWLRLLWDFISSITSPKSYKEHWPYLFLNLPRRFFTKHNISFPALSFKRKSDDDESRRESERERVMGRFQLVFPMRMSVSHWQSVSYETSAGIGLWLRNLGGSSSTQEIWKKKIWKNMQGSAPLWSTFGNWNPINANYRSAGKKTMSWNAETKQRDSVAWHEYAKWEAGWKILEDSTH